MNIENYALRDKYWFHPPVSFSKNEEPQNRPDRISAKETATSRMAATIPWSYNGSQEIPRAGQEVDPKSR
jgi:hypothetical protein